LRPDGKPGFDTPTGKFEIWSTILDDFGHEPLPKYTEVCEGPVARPDLLKDFPLVFNSGARPHTDFRSQHHGIEGLNKDNPEPTMEMNLADAKVRGIAMGDLVEVRTQRGAVAFRARVSEDIVAGAIECNMGGGTPVGNEAWQKSNVNELTDVENYDEISGFPVYKALLCEVVKVGEGTAESRAATTKRVTGGGEIVAAERAAPRRRIHMDNSATTPISKAVRDAMAPYLAEAQGNPSSLHDAGRQAREALAKARRQVARLINAKPKRIIFTGGGSEADNMAIKGLVFADPGRRGHIITTAIEHPAILKTCAFVEKLGWRVTYLPVDASGLVSVEALSEAMSDDTVLVSIMAANNEVGTVQPIAELVEVTHAGGALFHTDAVQAVGKIPVDVEAWGVDMLSLSAHKLEGPKGVGALYLREGVELEPLIHGGSQESRRRAGTENVAGIVGLGRAAEMAAPIIGDMGKIAVLRDQIETGVRALIPNAQLNGAPNARLPNVLNLTLPDLRGESLVVAMDQRGVALSSGSACKAGSPDPTHVLLAMGRSNAEAHCSVRFSLSHETTEQDVEDALNALAEVLEEMATTIRFLSCK